MAQNAEQPAAEVTWTGTIARFTFRNQETGFAVLRLTPDGGGALRTAVGVLAQFSEGQRLRLTGKVSEHPKFGRQLEARTVEAEAPKTAEGVIAYLSSGLVKGLGPATARRIVEQLGPEALARIETEPEQLAKVKGLGGRRAEELVAAIQEQRDLHGVLVFLRSHGLGAALAMRVFKRYGRGAAALIQADPYRLADDVIGVGFKTADQLAQRLGLALDAPARVRAGALFALGEAARDGHCFLPTDALVQATVDLLDVSATLVEPALPDLAQDGRIVLEPVAGGARAYPRTLHLAEVGCARRLRELADASARPLPIGAAEAVEWFVQRSGMALPDGQRRALATALQHSVSVITGGPGVGKTTIVRALVAILREHGLKLRLCAPTGRAAKRLEESTQHAATTIHRLLEFQAGVFRFQRASDHPIEGDMLVVDEASMLDIQLAYALLRAVPPGMRVVFVGDADQLPAVGPGNFLRDLIDSGELPVTALREVFRQQKTSAIVLAAHEILHGHLPVSGGEGSDFYVIETQNSAQTQSLVRELVVQRIPRKFGLDPFRDIQVLCPMYRGDVGADALNEALRDALNPQGEAFTRGNTQLRVGDKVLQIRNDHDREVFNGDAGRVAAIDLATGKLQVQFGERKVDYTAAELDQLVPGYAISVHRSQGSEYPAVVLPMATEHYLMLRRNLLYTAVTRGRRLVVVAGTAKAIRMAVENGESLHRNSGLAERLREA